MEKKMVKDTTKEDHYVEIAVGFKIIYNQNQYLAYTEVPKKKKDVRLEIYIGRVSLLKGQYLLFKCETDSERQQVFSYFKQVFSGENNDEIELVDFSAIERMSIVSSDLFEEKMDQYPNFFTLPKKEDEISVNITLPNFLMKKTSKIKGPSEEIQFVGDHDEVLESNVEIPDLASTVLPKENVESIDPISASEPTAIESSKNEQPVLSSIQNGQMDSSLTPTPIETVSGATIENSKIQPELDENIEVKANQETMPPEEISSPTDSKIQMDFPVPSTSYESTIQNVPESITAPAVSLPKPVTEVVTPVDTIVPETKSTLNAEKSVEEPVKFQQIHDDKKRKSREKKGKTSIIVLMVITLLLIASIAAIYIFVLDPQRKPSTPIPPIKEPETPKTSDLVCTIEAENKEDNSLENKTITFVYDNASKNILSSKEHATVTMPDADAYMQRKAMIKVFSQELNNTDGQKYTFKYDDKKYIYQVFIDRDYEKATDLEKDDTWKSTFDEANEYYLGKGYTCNGMKKESSDELQLTSTTENNTIDYNNWVVVYQKAVLSKDKETLSITLEVKNNGSETRTLNGMLKLFDKDHQNVRNAKINQQITPGEASTIVIEIKSSNESKNPELGSLETVNFENISQYLVELYR